MPALVYSVSSSSLRTLRWALLGAILGVGILSGCSENSRSEKRLPDSTFTQVLTELHLAKVRQSQAVPSPPGLRDSIFAQHDVPASDFEATLRYYSRRPKTFESLYQTVIDTLQTLNSPARRRTIPEGVPDSLYQKRRGEATQ